jgi:hypothetical protein
VKLALGVALVLYAVRRWRRLGTPRKPPGWMSRLDHLSPWAAAGLAAFLQPCALVAAGAATITQAKLSPPADYLARKRHGSRFRLPCRAAPRAGGLFPPPAGKVWMRARWIAPDGRPRSGWAVAGAQATAGSTTRIWVTRSGSPSGPPLQPSQLRGHAEMAGVLAPSVLALMLGLAGGAGRYLLGRHRAAHWDQEWQAVGSR